MGSLRTASHFRLDVWRRADEERLEGADLGTATQLFPLYVRARPPQPPDVYHQPSCFLSLSLSLPLSPHLSLSRWGSLNRALPVIMHTQFTRRSLKWVECVQPYDSMFCIAKRRKREKRLLDGFQLSRCGFLDVNYGLAAPSDRTRVCVYACIRVSMLCLRVCAYADDNGRLAAERAMGDDGVCVSACTCVCEVCERRGTSSRRREDGIYLHREFKRVNPKLHQQEQTCLSFSASLSLSLSVSLCQTLSTFSLPPFFSQSSLSSARQLHGPSNTLPISAVVHFIRRDGGLLCVSARVCGRKE